MRYDFDENCAVNSDDKKKNNKNSLFVGHKKEISGDRQKEIITVSHRKPLRCHGRGSELLQEDKIKRYSATSRVFPGSS